MLWTDVIRLYHWFKQKLFINPFTAMMFAYLKTLDFYFKNNLIKVQNLKTLGLFVFFFAQARERIFIKKQ